MKNENDTDDENIHDHLRKFIIEIISIEIRFVESTSCVRNHKRRDTTVSSFASSIVNNLSTRPCWLVLR